MTKKTAGQAARDIWAISGIGQKLLATKMGLNAQQAVYSLLNAKNGMRVDNFVKMMGVLGYDVVVRHCVTDEETMLIAGKDEIE